MEEASQDFVYFTILEDVFSKARDYPKSSIAGKMSQKVWRNFPEDLQHMVLLWLPAASQARLSRVCRRWRKLMKSASFREKTAALAWNSGDCKAIFTGKHNPKYQVIVDAGGGSSCKMRKVSLDTFPSDLPHDVLAPVYYANQFQWLAHRGVLAVAVEDEDSLRVCVLDLADESWQELPRLMLESPCAELSDPRSWEACLYDAVYDLQQRRWRYKVFVSWVRQVGDDDDEDEDCENMRPRTSFHVYSSTTKSWIMLVAALEPLELEAELPEMLQPVYLLEYVVGQGRTVHIYAKTFFNVNEDEGSVDVLRLSMEGSVIATLPAVQGLPEWGGGWLVLLDASLTPFCVFRDCTIYRCTWLQWTKTTSLPPEIKAKMLHLAHQEGRQRHLMIHAYMLDPIIFLDVEVQGGGPQMDDVCYALAYHIVEDSWELIAGYSGTRYEHPTMFLST